jgi:hypothetical protein
LPRTRAAELARLALGYAEIDGGRSKGDRCRRARPFIERGLDAYRGLAKTTPLYSDAKASFADLQAAAARCGIEH